MKISTFNALKSRNYRLYFVGQSISLVGTWMQKTAVSWVVYSLTHSKLMLGLSLFASQFPSFIFSFLGGAVSDRYNRYKVLLATQAASMIQAVLITLLVAWGRYSVWHILGLSAMLGFINAFDVPARQFLVNELVPDRKYLANALALNSSMVNLSRLVGPAIAGILLEKFGEVFCFGLNAFSFIAVITCLLLMKLSAAKVEKRQKNLFQDIREGWNYLRHEKSIMFIIGMLGLISLFVLPFSTLIPVYAKDIFKGTASTFGIIDSMIGLGAFCGALFLASLGPDRNFHRILAINTVVFGTGLMLFSFMELYGAALVCAMITGFGMMSQITISNTLIQTTVKPSMRGRVISFYAMAFFGMQPLGGVIVGSLSQLVGVRATVLAEGLLAVGVGCVHFWFLRHSNAAARVRKIEAVQPPEVAAS
ncbi:MAG TPA: MFS transporter [Chitinophagaceae bacterium]